MAPRNKIRFFRQHSMETCGASCALMVLDYYRKVQYPTKKQEMKLYSLYRCQCFKGISGASLADCLSKNGLQVDLYHSSFDLLENRDGYFREDLFCAFLAEYQMRLEECAGRVQVFSGKRTELDSLKNFLSEGRQIIAECIIPGDADGIHDHTLHWVLIYGYEGGHFLVCDPLSSKIRLTDAELKNYMDTPLGQTFLTVYQ